MAEQAIHTKRNSLGILSIWVVVMLCVAMVSCKTQKEAVKTEPEESLSTIVASYPPITNHNFPTVMPISPEEELDKFVGTWAWESTSANLFDDTSKETNIEEIAFCNFPQVVRIYKNNQLMFETSYYVYSFSNNRIVSFDVKQKYAMDRYYLLKGDTLFFWKGNEDSFSIYIKKQYVDLINQYMDSIDGTWTKKEELARSIFYTPWCPANIFYTRTVHFDKKDSTYEFYYNDSLIEKGKFSIQIEPIFYVENDHSPEHSNYPCLKLEHSKLSNRFLLWDNEHRMKMVPLPNLIGEPALIWERK